MAKPIGKVSLNLGPLQRLKEDLETFKSGRVKVGVLTGGNSRGKGEMGNADLGVIHEFGSPVIKIPQRSFLRMPLIKFLPEAIKALGVDKWRELILNQGLYEALVRLGVLAENIVQDAFGSGGFGEWPPLKPATIKRKKSSAILIDTAKLRRSITSKVVEGNA
jgi:hypothetical protein